MKVGQLGQNQADSGSWFPAVSHQVSPPPPPSSIILGVSLLLLVSLSSAVSSRQKKTRGAE